MAWFAFLALVLWLPIVFTIFEKYSIQKAIVYSFVIAWLFLPTTQIPIPSFPDWSKTTATVVSVLLCVGLKQPQRILGIRYQWFDLPVTIFCFCPFISSIVNNQGAYDGFSAVLEEGVRWGLPYLIGRAYLTDAQGLRQLCLGIAVGGMVYMPLCLFELRMSPILSLTIYGFNGRGGMDFGMRYGGYRPMVFLSFGLELGWWMCCATLSSYMLWASGSVNKISGYPLKVITALLAVVTIACKATGALTLLLVGFVMLTLSRTTKTTILIWALMSVPPIYCIARPLGYMTGEQLVSISDSLFGADRAQSLAFRFDQEEYLMRSAMNRPVFGWSRNGGFNPVGADGKALTTDGYWIIVFGTMGYVGLVCLNGMLLIPTILFLRRFPVETWKNPDVAPVTTFALILPLFLIDNLSNAMLNPIYAIAMGAVSGYVPKMKQQIGNRSFFDQGSKKNRLDEPHDQDLDHGFVHDAAANRVEADAVAADEQETFDEAETLFRQAIQSRQAAIRTQKTAGRLDQLARTHVLYARLLTKLGHREFAIVERERAQAIWRSLRESPQLEVLSEEAYASNLNDLAWLLVVDHQSDPSRFEDAVALAEEGVQLAPQLCLFWNTLGIAHYRRKDYLKSIYALGRSVSLSPDGGNAFDFYYLALANQALGYSKPAVDWLDRADSWAKKHPDLSSLLGDVQTEASDKIRRSAIAEKIV